MSTERAGFVAAIAADPNDRTARLVYADWLQEHGEIPAEALAAAGLRKCGRTEVIERMPRDHRQRSLLVTIEDCPDVPTFMAVAHAIGVPRPGETHPVYGYAVSGISWEAIGRSTAEVGCSHY